MDFDFNSLMMEMTDCDMKQVLWLCVSIKTEQHHCSMKGCVILSTPLRNTMFLTFCNDHINYNMSLNTVAGFTQLDVETYLKST